MSFFEFDARHLQLGVVCAFEKYGVDIDIERLQKIAGVIQDIRYKESANLPEAMRRALNDASIWSSPWRDAFKTALGVVFNQRRKKTEKKELPKRPRKPSVRKTTVQKPAFVHPQIIGKRGQYLMLFMSP